MAIRLTTHADSERRTNSDERVHAATFTIKIKCWLVEAGCSQETSIEVLDLFTNDSLLQYQVCIAIVRMLWHVEPLARLCQDHLVVDSNMLVRSEMYEMLRLIGFKQCNCIEFGLNGESYEKWCFGNRTGTAETDTSWHNFEQDQRDEEEEDDDDDDDDNDDDGDDDDDIEDEDDDTDDNAIKDEDDDTDEDALCAVS